MYNKVADIYCKDPNLLLSVFNEMLEAGMGEEEALSHLYAFCPTKRAALYLRNALPISWNNIFICQETRNSKNPTDPKEVEKYIKWIKTFNNMKFDYVIQNPPYDGKRNLFVKFFNEGLDILSVNGRMVIIGPATWLINIRKNGKATLYNDLKDRVAGNVVKVEMENLNNPFGTGLYVPFATITIDKEKKYDTIDFICCGEKKTVKSIYDCNLVGEHETIWSILDKCQKFGDVMGNHITNEEKAGMSYAKYDEIVAFGIDPADGLKNLGRSKASKNDNNYVPIKFGEYSYSYIQTAFHRIVGITESIPKKLKGGSTYDNPKYSDNNADCIYGTRQELENWKHFIFNNKLPLFLNIVLTIDQNNVSQPYLPWLVDKQYTDEEINKLFGFTDEEIALIDRTIKKYERNSSWFKRYMCGPDSASDEEVQKFIDNL